MSRVVLLLLLCGILILPMAGDAGQRGLLWRVVQTCIANHRITGAAFPCLAVNTERGRENGYAIIRAPLEDTHIIVIPTVRTIGVEAERLRGDSAPPYFNDAWESRHFVTDDLPKKPERNDLGLAVNSRLGRSQDQLHIHVDCLRPDVKKSLDKQLAGLRPDTWKRITVLPQAPKYWARTIESPDLSKMNVFDVAATGLKLDQEDVDDMTIVVAGATINNAPGFILLARQRQDKWNDLAHGEALLDHYCGSFR